jgi:hypothetical protein
MQGGAQMTSPPPWARHVAEPSLLRRGRLHRRRYGPRRPGHTEGRAPSLLYARGRAARRTRGRSLGACASTCCSGNPYAAAAPLGRARPLSGASEKDAVSAQKVGPTAAFCRCTPTGMCGPTCNVWGQPDTLSRCGQVGLPVMGWGAVPRRARPHCRFAPPLVHVIPDSLWDSVPLFLTRQCDWTPGPRPRPLPHALGQQADRLWRYGGGFGRTVASEIESPIIVANLV